MPYSFDYHVWLDADEPSDWLTYASWEDARRLPHELQSIPNRERVIMQSYNNQIVVSPLHPNSSASFKIKVKEVFR